MLTKSELINGSTIVNTANEFKPGDRVRHRVTGETGVVFKGSDVQPDQTAVIYDDEGWGTIYHTPTRKLELLLDDDA